MYVYLTNSYFIDVNGLVDNYLHNSINIFVPVSYSYNSLFFFEDELSHSNILDQFYFNQKKLLYE